MTSDSGFIAPEQFSHEWQNIRVMQTRRDNVIYTGERFGRRFLLKSLQPECASLTEYRLQQEKEFRLGIALAHPHIAATYSLEDVPEIGRCIVQEWIDGQRLGEWLQTCPNMEARQRVWEQLLDALAYMHSQQRVHHDLKSSNILITRSGQNLKLIDFGLADSDDSTCSESQDVRDDIRSLASIIALLFPHRYRGIARRCAQGSYANVASLQHAWKRRQRERKSVPMVLAIILLVVSFVFFCLAYQARHAEQRKQQQMMARVDEAFSRHAEQVQARTEQATTFTQTTETLAQLAHEGWGVRDSLMALYPEDDPIRVLIFDVWTQRESALQTSILEEAKTKPLY